MGIQLTLTRDKVTKNTVRFTEDLDEDRERGVIGSVYVLKTELDNLDDAERISVIIEPLNA